MVFEIKEQDISDGIATGHHGIVDFIERIGAEVIKHGGKVSLGDSMIAPEQNISTAKDLISLTNRLRNKHGLKSLKDVTNNDLTKPSGGVVR